MKLNNSELASEPLLGTSSPPLPPRSNNSKSAVVPGSMYSPSLKSSKSDPQQAVSRIHCIPLLMLSVFLILWAASSEVLPSVKTTTHARTAMKSSGTEEVEVKSTASTNEMDLQPSGSRTVLLHHERDLSSQSNDAVAAAASLRKAHRSRDKLPGKAQLRGNVKP